MKLQKRLTIHQTDLLPNQRGYYRGMAGDETNVRVGTRVCPDYKEVKGLMANWLKTYKKNTPIVNHIEFEKIHPFRDGNGRTGRMLMWYQEIHEGELPTLWENDEKQVVYYPMFR
jgi:Fic family protein